MKKIRCIILSVILWLLGGMTVSAGGKEASVVTDVQSGGVRIQMKQYEDMREMKKWENKENVLPGETIPMITVVENPGEDCYIRYRLWAEAKSGQEIPQTAFLGVPDGHILKGEFRYQTEKLAHGEQTVLFHSFQLPEAWEQKEDDSITVNIIVDAVQSRNFIPDFRSDSPWGTTVVQKVSEGEDDRQIRVVTPQKGSCQVLLEGDRILTVPDSFFSEFATMVPGDVIQSEILIDNQEKGAEDVYWKLAGTEKSLLDQMKLKIEKEDGSILFQGAFREFADDTYQLLGTYQSLEKTRLIFTLAFPEEADNVYRRKSGKMIWTFRAVSEEKKSDSVKTGETSHGLLTGVFLLSLLLIIRMAVRRRKCHG